MSDDIITTEKDTKKKGTAKKGRGGKINVKARGGKANVGKKKLVKQHLGTFTVGCCLIVVCREPKGRRERNIRRSLGAGAGVGVGAGAGAAQQLHQEGEPTRRSN